MIAMLTLILITISMLTLVLIIILMMTGKSTLLNFFNQFPEFAVHKEPLDQWQVGFDVSLCKEPLNLWQV